MEEITIDNAIDKIICMWGIEGLNDKIAENQDIVRMLAAACLTFDEINDRLDSSLYSNEEKIQGVKESIYYISSLFPDSRRLCGIAYFFTRNQCVTNSYNTSLEGI